MKERELCLLKEMLNSHHCRSILTGADSNFIRFLCDCFVNVFLGQVPANKILLRVRKYHLKKLLTLSLVSQKNEKFWQTIFHWLNQSENRVTFI